MYHTAEPHTLRLFASDGARSTAAVGSAAAAAAAAAAFSDFATFARLLTVTFGIADLDLVSCNVVPQTRATVLNIIGAELGLNINASVLQEGGENWTLQEGNVDTIGRYFKSKIRKSGIVLQTAAPAAPAAPAPAYAPSDKRVKVKVKTKKNEWFKIYEHSLITCMSDVYADYKNFWVNRNEPLQPAIAIGGKPVKYLLYCASKTKRLKYFDDTSFGIVVEHVLMDMFPVVDMEDGIPVVNLQYAYRDCYPLEDPLGNYLSLTDSLPNDVKTNTTIIVKLYEEKNLKASFAYDDTNEIEIAVECVRKQLIKHFTDKGKPVDCDLRLECANFSHRPYPNFFDPYYYGITLRDICSAIQFLTTEYVCELRFNILNPSNVNGIRSYTGSRYTPEIQDRTRYRRTTPIPVAAEPKAMG